MRLGERIKLLIRAKMSHWWRGDEDRTEAALRRADKMEALLEQLGERLNRALARQARLESQLRQAEEMARQWDYRADDTLRAGDEAAAREAIRQKLTYTQIASELQFSLGRQTAATRELQADLTRLESRLARVREKPRTPSPSAPPVTSSTLSQPATEKITRPVVTTVTAPASPREEAAEGMEALRERMSRVWSDEEIENELDAIKNRLSAGRSTDTES